MRHTRIVGWKEVMMPVKREADIGVDGPHFTLVQNLGGKEPYVWVVSKYRQPERLTMGAQEKRVIESKMCAVPWTAVNMSLGSLKELREQIDEMIDVLEGQ